MYLEEQEILIAHGLYLEEQNTFLKARISSNNLSNTLEQIISEQTDKIWEFIVYTAIQSFISQTTRYLITTHIVQSVKMLL